MWKRSAALTIHLCSLSEHAAVLSGADGFDCDCDSTEDQTADWRLKISPIDASLFKSPFSCELTEVE